MNIRCLSFGRQSDSLILTNSILCEMAITYSVVFYSGCINESCHELYITCEWFLVEGDDGEEVCVYWRYVQSDKREGTPHAKILILTVNTCDFHCSDFLDKPYTVM